MKDPLLAELLSLPTAPYRETHVRNFVRRELARRDIPFFEDPHRNILVGAGSWAQYQALLSARTDSPVCLFVAHMDHPGFHGERWVSKDVLGIRWFGGSPQKHLEGAPVWVADSESFRARGRLSDVRLRADGRAIDRACVRLEETRSASRPDPGGLFGAFQFTHPFWRRGGLIYTKAADDFMGVYAILLLAFEFARKKRRVLSRPTFLGLLTRAEEVGFIGAISHFDLGWLKANRRREVLCVSLETSRTLPGADVGKGPVVRIGDKASVFDGAATELLTERANRKLKGRYQKRVMDGGTCEGTVAVAYGFRTAALSIPLGNYHNEGFEGGPESRGPRGPAPEFVHQEDLRGMVELCRALLREPVDWEKLRRERIGKFKKSLRAARSLLSL